MSEFKQIIGRGTRVREDKGKLFLNILDDTGGAAQKFADPGFDGEPTKATAEAIDDEGQVIEDTKQTETDTEVEEAGIPQYDDVEAQPRKYYVHGGRGDIDTEVTNALDAAGGKLRTVQITRYAGETVRILNEILDKYAEHGTGQFAIPDALEVPPISAHGNVVGIAKKFGGADRLLEAVGRPRNCCTPPERPLYPDPNTGRAVDHRPAG